MAAATNTDVQSPPYSVPFIVASHHLRILHVTENEADKFAEVFQDSFQHDVVFKAMNGTADLVKVHENTAKAWRDTWDARGNKWFKIVDEDRGNRIAAIAKWGFPHTPEENQPAPPPSLDVPGENTETKAEFYGTLQLNRQKNWKKEDMYLMNILAVRPEYQRLGLGSQLLAPVLKLADQEGRKAYIEASAAGQGLYKKFGWRTIDEFDLDLRKAPGFEDKGIVRSALMMREPGAGGPGL